MMHVLTSAGASIGFSNGVGEKVMYFAFFEPSSSHPGFMVADVIS